MTLGRRNPFDEIERLFDQMSEEFQAVPDVASGSLSVDVADHDDEFVVTADLPGFEKSDIEVTLSDSTLRIDASRESSVEGEEADYIRRERRRESASRSVRLPEPVDEEGVDASLTNGVLTVTLPKRDAGEGGRQIEIE